MENIDKQPNQSNTLTSTPTSAPEPVPEIPESEMKLPEEQFGNEHEADKTKDHIVSPLLVVALIFVLVILGAVVVWGDLLIGLIVPAEQNQLEVMEDTKMEEEVIPEETVTEEDINAIEAELETQVDFTDLDNDLNSIEAELDAAL